MCWDHVDCGRLASDNLFLLSPREVPDLAFRGYTESPHHDYPYRLREVNVPIVPRKECDAAGRKLYEAQRETDIILDLPKE
jgi:hypothetical protein